MLCAGWALHGIGPAHAQSQAYPNRPIRWSAVPGRRPTDGMARIISDRLGAVLGQTIVIENRGGGAGGSVGAKAVATADPDGYTILITPGGALTTGPAVHNNIGYDPAKAFVPVGLLIETPLIMSRSPGPAGEIAGRGRGLRQGQSGQDQLGLAGLRHRAAPARRTVQARSRRQHRARALSRNSAHARRPVAGEVQIVTDPSTTALPHIQSGKLRPIAITGTERIRNCPTCRPRRKQAIRSCTRRSGSAWWRRPGRRPRSSTSSTRRSAKASRRRRRARGWPSSAPTQIGTPAEFGQMLADELALWTEVVKAAHIKVE